MLLLLLLLKHSSKPTICHIFSTPITTSYQLFRIIQFTRTHFSVHSDFVLLMLLLLLFNFNSFFVSFYGKDSMKLVLLATVCLFCRNDLRNCFRYFEIFYYSIMRFIVNQFSIAINKCANKCPANFERLRNNNIFPRIGDWAESAATFSNEMDVYHNTTHYVCSKVQTPKSSTFILFVFHFQTNVGFTQPTTIQWYTIWMVITSHSCSLLKEAFAMKTKKKSNNLIV